jgi:hypothetical protein
MSDEPRKTIVAEIPLETLVAMRDLGRWAEGALEKLGAGEKPAKKEAPVAGVSADLSLLRARLEEIVRTHTPPEADGREILSRRVVTRDGKLLVRYGLAGESEPELILEAVDVRPEPGIDGSGVELRLA